MNDKNTPSQRSVPQQLAQVALDLIAKANITADDQSLDVVRQVRGFLGAIARGQIVVGQPVAEDVKVPADAVHLPSKQNGKAKVVELKK